MTAEGLRITLTYGMPPGRTGSLGCKVWCSDGDKNEWFESVEKAIAAYRGHVMDHILRDGFNAAQFANLD